MDIFGWFLILIHILINLIILPQPTKSSSTHKCYGELGCLDNTGDWIDMVHRPLTYLPWERDQINTRFFYYNRNRTSDAPQVFLNKTHLLDQGFDPEKPSKFVAHGYLDQGQSFWMIQLPQALLTAGDFNIFGVDWGGGSHTIYTQAAANTRLVGLEIAHYIKFLEKEFGVNASNVHCIGHSLGAHICAYAGNGVEGLGRITGLDPADPLFQYMPPIVRLSPDDAKFIDIVHTDGQTILLGGLGFIEPCGHIDFYPNEGKSQPGCEVMSKPKTVINSGGIDEAGREAFACDHHRAIFYFMEAVISKCRFVGHRCKDYATYLRGDCWSCGQDGSECTVMGLDADKYDIGSRSLVSFYLSTAKAAPFCVRHYRIVITLGQPQKAAGYVPGRLKIKMFGTEIHTDDLDLTPNSNLRFYHGTSQTFLTQTSTELGDISRVKLSWKYEQGYMDAVSTCLFYRCSNKLIVSRVEIFDIDQGPISGMEQNLDDGTGTKGDQVSITLCGDGDKKYVGIQSGSSAIFKRPC